MRGSYSSPQNEAGTSEFGTAVLTPSGGRTRFKVNNLSKLWLSSRFSQFELRTRRRARYFKLFLIHIC